MKRAALMPAHVDVGTYRYAVTVDTAAINAERNEARSSDLTGSSNHRRQAIVLDPDLGRDALAETLAHEVIHCWLAQFESGLEPDAEEALVLALGFHFVDTVRRNPDLVRYLGDTSHRDRAPDLVDGES